MKLQGRRIALTGGSGGIGSELLKRIIAAGGSPLVIGRAVQEFNECIRGDLSTIEGITAVARQLAERQPDILINLAGIQYFGLLENQPPEDVARMLTINLLAPVMLTQAVLPAMKALNSGQIVNIGSVFGSIPFAHFITYSTTKAGLKAFSQGLRRELAESEITVTHISPRAVKTPLNTALIQQLANKIGMTVDSPELVAQRIIEAIEVDAEDVIFGKPESFFTHMHALLPRVVDKALAKNDRIARQLVS